MPRTLRDESEADFHRKRPAKRELDAVRLEQERVFSLDWVVTYEGKRLQLEPQSRHHGSAKNRGARENQQGQISIEYRWHKLPWLPANRPRQHQTTLGSKPTNRCLPTVRS